MHTDNIIMFGEAKPSTYLEICKLRLRFDDLSESDRNYLEVQMKELEVMVEAGNIWLDFGDGELS